MAADIFIVHMFHKSTEVNNDNWKGKYFRLAVLKEQRTVAE